MLVISVRNRWKETRCAASFLEHVRIKTFFSLRGHSTLSLLAMFSMNKNSHLNRVERILSRVFTALTLVSFMLSMQTVVISTAASTKVMHGTHDPLAESSYELLMREFEYEFITCRLGYLGALVLLIVAIFLRILIEMKLLSGDNNEKRSTKAIAAVSLSGISLSCHVLSYINSSVFCAPNLPSMALKWLGLVFKRAQTHPLQAISLATGAMGVVFALLSFFSDIQEDNDGPPSRKDVSVTQEDKEK